MTRRLARAFSALAVAVVLVALPVALDACEVTCQAPHQPAAGAHCHHSAPETATVGHLAHACRQGHGALIPRTHDVRDVLHGASPVDVYLAVAPTPAPPWQACRFPTHSPGGFSRLPNSSLRI